MFTVGEVYKFKYKSSSVQEDRLVLVTESNEHSVKGHDFNCGDDEHTNFRHFIKLNISDVGCVGHTQLDGNALPKSFDVSDLIMDYEDEGKSVYRVGDILYIFDDEDEEVKNEVKFRSDVESHDDYITLFVGDTTVEIFGDGSILNADTLKVLTLKEFIELLSKLI